MKNFIHLRVTSAKNQAVEKSIVEFLPITIFQKSYLKKG